MNQIIGIQNPDLTRNPKLFGNRPKQSRLQILTMRDWVYRRHSLHHTSSGLGWPSCRNLECYCNHLVTFHTFGLVEGPVEGAIIRKGLRLRNEVVQDS